MNSSLIIITERLRIVPLQTKHITKDYVSWLNDKELMQFSEQRHRVHTMTTCEIYLSSFENSQNILLALEDLGGNLIGTVTIYRDLQNGIVDMGILIGAKSAHGKGYGAEAWGAVANWIESNLKPRKLTAGCMGINLPMLKLMESIGMQPDGTRKKHFLMNGKPVDIVYMAKLINE